MAFKTIAGSKLYISAVLPADLLPATYAALTWTEIKPLSEQPSVKGRNYNIVEFTAIGTRQTEQKKGSYKLPEANFKCAWDRADAGQVIVRAASLSDSLYAFKVEEQGAVALDTAYFQGLVSKFMQTGASADDILMGEGMILIQVEPVAGA